MKRKLAIAFAVLIMLASAGALFYPAFSDWWNSRRQDQLLTDYEATAAKLTKEDFSKEWARARAYNDSFTENNIYGDAFGENSYGSAMDGTYESVLNVAGNGIMGHISIPKIKVNIAIYHGVSDETLERGAGHLPGTKLPIGGAGNNTVIAAHRGLPSARLFTDIDQLGAGDVFELHILDEVLYYKVDKIWAMVDRYDSDTMTEAMSVVPGEDYATLFTCTPYGVNSHRLIVRGKRFNPTEDELMAAVRDQGMLRIIWNHNAMALIAGLAAVIAAMAAWSLQGYMIRIRKIRRIRRSNAKTTAGRTAGGKGGQKA